MVVLLIDSGGVVQFADSKVSLFFTWSIRHWNSILNDSKIYFAFIKKTLRCYCRSLLFRETTFEMMQIEWCIYSQYITFANHYLLLISSTLKSLFVGMKFSRMIGLAKLRVNNTLANKSDLQHQDLLQLLLHRYTILYTQSCISFSEIIL